MKTTAHMVPDAAVSPDDIQGAIAWTSTILSQLAEHLEEMELASADTVSDRLDRFTRKVRARRIAALCDRGRDFIDLARQQVNVIHAFEQAQNRREIDEHRAAECAVGGQA